MVKGGVMLSHMTNYPGDPRVGKQKLSQVAK
jgi:hypothetical protein